MKTKLTINNRDYHYYPLEGVESLPYSLRILYENALMRGYSSYAEALLQRKIGQEIAFHPARVLMQDFTGVPAIVDLATMREYVKEASLINPHIPVDLIVDHSVQVDYWGSDVSLEQNVAKEYERNKERYTFLKWAQKSFSNLRVVPPNSGICHQVNLEYLAQVVREEEGLLYSDTLVGTDSHTPMINGLGILGWGVGGIEAEAAMLGQPYFMGVPRVVGVHLTGEMDEVCTATDLVLTITHLLRKVGVVEAFVEYFGSGLASLAIPDRATIANMSVECGSTVGFFPVDERTLEYLRFTGREEEALLTELYTKANHLFYSPSEKIVYDEVIELDLGSIVPSIAGPRRPQDKIPLSGAKEKIVQINTPTKVILSGGSEVTLKDNMIAIAAITSCTNTSNPSVIFGAALLARNAIAKGLKVPPWVKTSLAPGSKVVRSYLEKAALIGPLEALGFNIVAYGCTTCIGNSGPLDPAIERAQEDGELNLVSVLSGNRNFEGRIHKNVKSSYLMSPPLVVAYALAGTMEIDFDKDQLGDGVYLKDIWPSKEEIAKHIALYLKEEAFKESYQAIFEGDASWQALEVDESERYNWDPSSTYIAKAPFFENLEGGRGSVVDGRALLYLGDSFTTDHISPAGSIEATYPAGQYLLSRGVSVENFNSYGSRRGHHEVMVRGTFGNRRIHQKLTPEVEGSYTKKFPSEEVMFVYEAAMAYQREKTDLIIIAGSEYGSGSSRDWAAKGALLLGVKAVIAKSFERIHRSNLVGMGVLPLEFVTEHSLRGDELFSLAVPIKLEPKMRLTLKVTPPSRESYNLELLVRLDSPVEVEYYQSGGILHHVLLDYLKMV
ncbi:MAG: aconitate hydratase AcnA [Sphaerochaetaceae bacterium]|jgi:aconitate hydratase|nr:aconitate hydratase AcnA [Sphaerochaetaceae bacterium]HHU88629.1 aconitate hydratase AcnA [Spirochaetales bacterium]